MASVKNIKMRLVKNSSNPESPSLLSTPSTPPVISAKTTKSKVGCLRSQSYKDAPISSFLYIEEAEQATKAKKDNIFVKKT